MAMNVSVKYSVGGTAFLKKANLCGSRFDYFNGQEIDEKKLLSALPNGFLPTNPKSVALFIEKGRRNYGSYEILGNIAINTRIFSGKPLPNGCILRIGF